MEHVTVQSAVYSTHHENFHADIRQSKSL